MFRGAGSVGVSGIGGVFGMRGRMEGRRGFREEEEEEELVPFDVRFVFARGRYFIFFCGCDGLEGEEEAGGGGGAGDWEEF